MCKVVFIGALGIFQLPVEATIALPLQPFGRVIIYTHGFFKQNENVIVDFSASGYQNHRIKNPKKKAGILIRTVFRLLVTPSGFKPETF